MAKKKVKCEDCKHWPCKEAGAFNKPCRICKYHSKFEEYVMMRRGQPKEKYSFGLLELLRRQNMATVEIPKDEMFMLVVKFAQHNRALVEKIAKAVRKEEQRLEHVTMLERKHKKGFAFTRIQCSFPFSCCKFPCDTLFCDADSLASDGSPYRRS